MNDSGAPRIAGAVPVLAMAFDDQGVIDEGGLRRQLDFCIEAGSEAVAFGKGSESAVLTDSEKVRVWSLAARHVDGRVPVIAATAHASRQGTLEHTGLARDCGVDCAMVNPAPYGGDDLVRLFRDLSESVDLPLMIQDAGGNAPAEVLLRAVDEAPRVSCLKLESQRAPDKIGAVVDGLRSRGLLGGGSRELTVLGGGNGNWLPEELDRGSVGSMPHPALIDSFRTVCDHYAAGDPEAGRQAYHGVLAPVQRALTVGSASPLWLHKTLFVRAGIFRSAHCRRGASALPDWLMEQVLGHLDAHGFAIARRIAAGQGG